MPPSTLTPILDSFIRANENPLSQGGAWSICGTGSGTHRSLLIASNVARGSVGGAFNGNYRTLGTYGPDCEVYVTWAANPAASSNYVRLYLRASALSGDSHNGYMLQWSRDANGCRLFQRTAGSTVLLAQDAANIPTTGDLLVFRAVRNYLAVYKNGALVISAKDTTWTAAGMVAIGDGNTDGGFTNFGAGTILGARCL